MGKCIETLKLWKEQHSKELLSMVDLQNAKKYYEKLSTKI